MSEPFSETRSQPPSPPSPASPPSPPSIPLPRSPSMASTPSTGSPRVSTAPAPSRASSQPTSAPSSHTSSTESSIFDLSVFFSLDPQRVMTRDPSPGMTSPSLLSSEADPQSIPQSMSSSQASENFTAPRGTWTVSTEEYPRATDNLQPNSQTSSEEGFLYFTETLPLSPPILISRCRGGTPQINSQATSPHTSNPQTRLKIPHTTIQVEMPGSWAFSRSTSPIPSPPLSNSQPSPQPHTATSSIFYPSPILHVTIMPGSWVSLPNSPIPSLLGSPRAVHEATTSSDPVPNTCTTSTLLITPTASTTPTCNDAENTGTSEITITIAGLNICNPTTNTNTNTCTNPSDNTDESLSINSTSNEIRSSRSISSSSSSSSSSSNTERPDAALTVLTTMRSSCEGGLCPPSPASSSGSFELGCVQ